jgi:hypothetical protein
VLVLLLLSIFAAADAIVLSSGAVTVVVSRTTGDIVRLVDDRAGREVVSPSRPGNAFTLYDDVPFFW